MTKIKHTYDSAGHEVFAANKNDVMVYSDDVFNINNIIQQIEMPHRCVVLIMGKTFNIDPDFVIPYKWDSKYSPDVCLAFDIEDNLLKLQYRRDLLESQYVVASLSVMGSSANSNAKVVQVYMSRMNYSIDGVSFGIQEIPKLRKAQIGSSKNYVIAAYSNGGYINANNVDHQFEFFGGMAFQINNVNKVYNIPNGTIVAYVFNRKYTNAWALVYDIISSSIKMVDREKIEDSMYILALFNIPRDNAAVISCCCINYANDGKMFGVDFATNKDIANVYNRYTNQVVSAYSAGILNANNKLHQFEFTELCAFKDFANDKIIIIEKGTNVPYNWTTGYSPLNALVYNTATDSVEVKPYTLVNKSHYILATFVGTGKSTDTNYVTEISQCCMRYAINGDVFNIPLREPNVIDRNIDKDCAVRCAGILVNERKNEIKPLAFIHTSDIHTRAVDYKCFEHCLEYLEHYPNLKFAIVTGDIVYNNFKDGMDWYDLALQKTSKPVFNVIGNHDAGQYVESDGLASYGNDKQVYDKFIAPYKSKWDLGAGDAGNGKSYYFKDFTEEKIRIIVLYEYETNFELNQEETNLLYERECRSVSQAQIDWLIQSLESTPDDYGVVVAYHMPERVREEDNAFVSEYLVDPNDWARLFYGTRHFYGDINQNWLLRIIDAFQNHKSLNISFQQTGGIVTTLNVNCDFTGKKSEFICVLAGHHHNDYVGHFHEFPKITVILIGANNMKYNGKYCQRAYGTPSEDLFNVVSIDRNRKSIQIIRIGANHSISGQVRDFININYQ